MKFDKMIQNENGFSLTELLVVIVIIGILASLAIPKFFNVTTKAKSTEAKLMLNQIYQLEIAFMMENDLYTADLRELGFEQEKLKTDGGKARYKIEITTSEKKDAFKASAIAVIDFDKDGIYNIWTVTEEGNIKEEIPD